MDAAAFAALYERHERQVYNLCYRITGSAHDAADATQETFLKVFERLPRLEGRELNFGAYVMTVARNASYDAIERRRRAVPTDEIPDVEDHERPERAALREAHQEQIRAANQTLPARQREVLALRELGDLSYGEVAHIMGMNQNSVAQLISRARINLRDGLRQTALGSVASASPQCDRALPLLAMRQDGVQEDPWLAEHLLECGACRVRLEAMEEAAVAYRQWLLLVPALWLREETAEAAERMSRRGQRGRRRLAAAGTTLVVLALVLLAAEHAQTPTRAFAPVADEPVRRVAAAPKPRVTKSPVVDAGRTMRVAEPRPVEPRVDEIVEPRVDEIVAAAAPVAPVAPVAHTKAAPPEPRVRPRRERRPQPVVAAEPTPAPAEPPAAVDTPTPPPPEPPPPEPPCTTARGCPPPPPPACTTCGLVAPPAPPEPPRLVGAPRRR